MISFDEAIERVGSAATPLATEIIAIGDALGRVLAAPVHARIDSPRADVSAMDGYAVRVDDLGHLPAHLRIVGQSFPGSAFQGIVEQGTCARIFTGAPVPKGANHVVIQEHVQRDEDLAIISAFDVRAPFIRAQASDFRSGDLLLPKGRLIDARAIIAAAGGDQDRLEVFRRARVTIVSTGDELVEPGTAQRTPYGVPESVSLGIAALAGQFGAIGNHRVHLRDDLAAVQSAAEQVCEDADLVIVTGGASVGEKDFAKDMFAPLGLQLIFSGVAIKPGKPVWFGKVGDRLVLGLPGNPTSALVTARLLMAPLLELMRGRTVASALCWQSAPLARSLEGCGPRETFHRAGWNNGAAEVLPYAESSAQKTLADAMILVRQRPRSPPLDRGALVEVLEL